MIDHVSIGVRDLAASITFYDAVMAALDYRRLETRETTAGWGKKYPEFWINQRGNAVASDGAHICFRARSRELVDAFYDAALAAGGTSDGAPGLRPHHGDGYYAAFVRDREGNKLEAVTFVTP